MIPPIRWHLRRHPPLQHLFLIIAISNFKNLHPQLPTTLLHAPRALRPKSPVTQIPAGTRAQGAQQIHLGEEVDVVARAGGARLHEIAAAVVEAGDLEEVEDVVDVGLGEAVGEDGADEVAVAVEVELILILLLAVAAEHGVDVGVAARAEEVVHSSTELAPIFSSSLLVPVPIVTKQIRPPLQTVGDNGDHRPQIW